MTSLYIDRYRALACGHRQYWTRCGAIFHGILGRTRLPASLAIEVGPPTTCRVRDPHLHHHDRRPNREPAHPWIVKK